MEHWELGQEERLLVQEKQDSIQSHSVGKKRLALLLLQQPDGEVEEERE